MTNECRHPVAVFALKALHTVIFAGEVAAILWLVVSGLVRRRDRSVGLAAAAVGTEAVVFLANGGVCPITPMTERLGAAHGGVSDIFLPDAVARTIPVWSTALIGLAVVLHARPVWSHRGAEIAQVREVGWSAGQMSSVSSESVPIPN